MNELAAGLFFVGWAGLVVLGLFPELGARVGLWLRSRVEPTPPPPPADPEWADDSLVGKNLDRLV